MTFKLAGGDKSDPVTVDTDSDIGEIKKTPTVRIATINSQERE